MRRRAKGRRRERVLTIVTNSTEEILDVRSRQSAKGLKAQRRVLRHTSGIQRLGSSSALGLGDLLRRALELGDWGQLINVLSSFAPFFFPTFHARACVGLMSGLKSTEPEST